MRTEEEIREHLEEVKAGYEVAKAIDQDELPEGKMGYVQAMSRHCIYELKWVLEESH